LKRGGEEGEDLQTTYRVEERGRRRGRPSVHIPGWREGEKKAQTFSRRTMLNRRGE
jgi:hypothetical protein